MLPLNNTRLPSIRASAKAQLFGTDPQSSKPMGSAALYAINLPVTSANSTAIGANGVGSDYKFRVKAFNEFGDSAWSDWAR